MSEGEQATGLERRLAELEAIVERLDGDDLELQEALDLFEDGIAHVREAFALLEKTRVRVEKLVVDMDGEVSIDAETATE